MKMNEMWQTGIGESKTDLLVILALSIPFIFWGIGSLGLLDPNEGLYGSVAREMAEGGDWITPRFNGVRYLEKPPLYFWLTAITMILFGPSEGVVRLWSAIPALGTALLIWRIGDFLYRGKAGLFSAIIFLTSAGIFRYGRVAAPDFLLVFSNTLAIYGLLMSCRANSDRRSPEVVLCARSSGLTGSLLFYLGMALGVLAKGLVGVLFPAVIAGLFLVINPRWQGANKEWAMKDSRRAGFSIPYGPFLANLAGLLLFLALTLPWHLLAALSNRGFFDFYILDNQFLRFLSARGFVEDDVPLSTVAFLLLTFIWFFPWSLFLPAALRFGLPNFSSSTAERLRLVVGLWALTVMGFFSLSSSKLEHYSLPAIPPLSLMVGGLWSEAFTSRSPVHGMKWCLSAAALGCALAGAALFQFSDHLTAKALLAGFAELNVYYRILQQHGQEFPFAVAPFIKLLKELGAILLIGLPLALGLYSFGRVKECFCVFVGVAAVIAILVVRLVYLIEPHHSTKFVAQALEARLNPGDSIVHDGSLEYSAGLPFYLDRPIHVVNGRRGDLDFGSHYPEARHLFLDAPGFARLWDSDRRVFLVTRFGAKESALKDVANRGFLLLGQYGSRKLYANR